MSELKIEQAIKDCRKHYTEGRLIPFIGSGFSKPLGLPDWGELLKLAAEELKYEPDLFLLHGNYQQLAEYLHLDKTLWDKFIHKINKNFNSERADEERKKSITHKSLASLKFKTIYTTNYDNHIEESFKDAGQDVEVLATLSQFLNSKNVNNCEVVKFHGTLENPDTLILTETRYFDRMDLEEAVDQKLRSDLLKNSFLFIGYSFNDPNIRYIWYKIDKLRKSPQEKNYNTSLRPSYFVTFGSGPIQPHLLDKWNINVINLDPINKTESLHSFLENLKES
jgi:hypothetical protein